MSQEKKQPLEKMIGSCDKACHRIICWPEHDLPGCGIGAAFGQATLMLITSPITVPIASPFIISRSVLKYLQAKMKRV